MRLSYFLLVAIAAISLSTGDAISVATDSDQTMTSKGASPDSVHSIDVRQSKRFLRTHGNAKKTNNNDGQEEERSTFAWKNLLLGGGANKKVTSAATTAAKQATAAAKAARAAVNRKEGLQKVLNKMLADSDVAEDTFKIWKAQNIPANKIFGKFRGNKPLNDKYANLNKRYEKFFDRSPFEFGAAN